MLLLTLHYAIATQQVALTAESVNPEQHDTLHLHLAQQARQKFGSNV